MARAVHRGDRGLSPGRQRAAANHHAGRGVGAVRAARPAGARGPCCWGGAMPQQASSAQHVPELAELGERLMPARPSEQAGDRRAPPGRRGPHVRGDRDRAVHLGPDRRAPRAGHLHQDRVSNRAATRWAVSHRVVNGRPWRLRARLASDSRAQAVRVSRPAGSSSRLAGTGSPRSVSRLTMSWMSVRRNASGWSSRSAMIVFATSASIAPR